MVNQPRLVLEARAQAGQVSWWLGADRNVVPRIVAALEPHLPGLRVDDSHDDRSAPTTAGQLRAPGHRRTPLDVSHTETVTRGLLGAMAQAKANEVITLQVVLGPRYRPARAPAVPDVERRSLQAKLGEYRFGCLLRLAANAARPERAHRLVAGVLSALRGLEAPGVRLQFDRTSPRRVSAAGSPLLWPLQLGVSEVVALLGWPIAERLDVELPGVPSMHPRQLPVTEAVASRGRLLGISSLDRDRPIALSVGDSLRHLHVLGPTGTGKSTLLARLALQDIEAGRGVAVVDPKGDLVADLLGRMPDHRRDDVVVLDPTDPAPVGIDGFARPADLAADTLLSVFHSLYADSWGPRTHDILHACLLTLARRGDASLAMIPLLLTNPGFRRSVTGRVARADPLGLGSFWSWFESISDGERTQAIAPLMNKLRPLLLRPGLRAVFGQRKPRFSLSDVFTKRRILLVSLSQGVLGPEAARLLGAIVVALLWQAAQARAAIPSAHRHPVMIFIDEVQEYLRLGDVGDALAQARGLGVGFTLAHQHLAQLPPSLREAVLANARSRVAFQLSAKDAAVMAKTTGGQLAAQDFQSLPQFQAYAQLLSSGSTAPWCSLSTEPLPPGSDRQISALRQLSGDRYGQALDDVERDLLELAGGADGPSAAAESLGRHRPGGES
jgi:hypothetical protein